MKYLFILVFSIQLFHANLYLTEEDSRSVSGAFDLAQPEEMLPQQEVLPETEETGYLNHSSSEDKVSDELMFTESE